MLKYVSMPPRKIEAKASAPEKPSKAKAKPKSAIRVELKSAIASYSPAFIDGLSTCWLFLKTVTLNEAMKSA